MCTKDSRGKQTNKQTLALAVDLEDAYNREQFKLLMELLVQCGVSLMLTRWLAATIQELKVGMRPGNRISTPHNWRWDIYKALPWSTSSTKSTKSAWRIWKAIARAGCLHVQTTGLSVRQPVTPLQLSPLSRSSWKRVTMVPRDRVQHQSQQGACPVVRPQ